MGHQHDSRKDIKPVKSVKPAQDESEEKWSHTFLEKNDITFLSMIRPLLSPNGQKLVSFFVDFDNQGSVNTPTSSLNIGDLLSQLSPNQKNSIAELAPSILGMLSNGDAKGSNGLNPALLTTLLSTMMNNSNTKKEE